MTMDLGVDSLTQTFQEKIDELQAEPDFSKGPERTKCALDRNGKPAVKLAIGNVPLEYDLWEGLRNPAVIGLYPAGLREIWEFHAHRIKRKAEEGGKQTIFQMPRSFDFALENYHRAVIISAMLPFSHRIVQEYVSRIMGKRKGSSYLFTSMYEEMNRLLDKAVTRAAIDLMTDNSDSVVVAMNNDNVKACSNEAIPQTRQGASHGPSKGSNYPQKSMAVLMGLGQFGISRLVFRDEFIDGRVERFAGPIRSIIVFDKQPLIKDGGGGVIFPSPAWRQFLFKLFDFTNTDRDINQYRFCSHIPVDDDGCGKCASHCSSGAQASSAPKSDGQYSEQVSRSNRFWAGKLQFDYSKCTDERNQMAGIFPEWSCARCITVCIDQGIKRETAARSYVNKISELTVAL